LFRFVPLIHTHTGRVFEATVADLDAVMLPGSSHIEYNYLGAADTVH
jgi:hypothetical protein